MLEGTLQFILAMLETERFLSGVLLLLVVGFGLFFTLYFWPWFTKRIDDSWSGWIHLRRKELQLEADRNERYANAWQQNNRTLIQMQANILELAETNKSLINVLLSFVDDKKLQGRLYEIFREDGQ